jgi:hypothetical protein
MHVPTLFTQPFAKTRAVVNQQFETKNVLTPVQNPIQLNINFIFSFLYVFVYLQGTPNLAKAF